MQRAWYLLWYERVARLNNHVATWSSASRQSEGMHAITVADLKNEQFEAADKESLLYAVNSVSEQLGPTHWPLDEADTSVHWKWLEFYVGSSRKGLSAAL